MLEKQKDEMRKARAEFMYNFFDYDNDRTRVRERFLAEMNKKTTLKDIGEQLDRFLIDEKGENLSYADLLSNETAAKTPNFDSNNFDWTWQKRIFRAQDPLTPLLMDDESLPLENYPEFEKQEYQDILDRLKYMDERTDYSPNTFTVEQKQEIALFHSMKQDPYFKHYLHNHLRRYAEDIDDSVLQFAEGPYQEHVADHAKFDRINLYDFRRALPQKEREAKLDQTGAAWGFGKRKTAKAFARVKPGKGTITINGKNMLDYFDLAQQRYKILLPLTLTNYTCLLDVDIWVHGGGLTGQPEAIVPAIAKAIQNFDVKTRPVLKFFRLMRHDTRNVERKKYGRIKARKGQVYRRR